MATGVLAVLLLGVLRQLVPTNLGPGGQQTSFFTLEPTLSGPVAIGGAAEARDRPGLLARPYMPSYRFASIGASTDQVARPFVVSGPTA